MADLEQTASQETAPSIEDDLSAAWDAAQASDAEEAPAEEAQAEAPAEDASKEDEKEEQPRAADGKFAKKSENETSTEDEPEEPENETEAKAEPPGNLPKGVREKWADLDDDVRDAFATSQNNMAAKLSEATRLYNGIKPVQDMLTNAASKYPELANISMQELNGRLGNMIEWEAAFLSDPQRGAGILATVADQYGLKDALTQILGGQQVDAGATASHEVAQLKHELAALRQDMAQTAAAPIENEVNRFAQAKGDDWELVEHMLPGLIETVQGENPAAAATEVLELAYERAAWAHPDLRAKLIAEQTATQEADQENQRAKEAAEAKATKEQEAQAAAKINVKQSGSGKSAPRTIDQELSATWDRLQAAG